MAAGVAYYVHEGWRDGEFIVCIHRGDCIFCNEGTGQVVNSFLRRGQWHGPYKTMRMASAKLLSVPDIATRVACACTQYSVP